MHADANVGYADAPNPHSTELRCSFHQSLDAHQGYKGIMSDKNAPVYLTKLHAAIAYAGANQLPCEIAELEREALVRREAQKAEKAAQRAAEKEMRAQKSAEQMKRKRESEAAHAAARAPPSARAPASLAATRATAPSGGASRKRPATRAATPSGCRSLRSSSVACEDRDNSKTVLPAHAQHRLHQGDNTAGSEGSMHTQDAHHGGNSSSSRMMHDDADGMNGRGAHGRGMQGSSCMHTSGMQGRGAQQHAQQSIGVHHGRHRSGNMYNCDEGMYRGAGEHEGGAPTCGSMLCGHGMQGISDSHQHSGVHGGMCSSGEMRHSMHAAMHAGCGNMHGNSMQGMSNIHSRTGAGMHCLPDGMQHSGCMHGSGMQPSISSMHSGSIPHGCYGISMPGGYAPPPPACMAPYAGCSSGTAGFNMLQTPMHMSQQPQCMGADYSTAMMRAELARTTQERLENERAARVREAQLRAFYGMGPM